MAERYTAEIESSGFEAHTPVGCGDCGWLGSCGDLKPIKTCVLTPGDPSPVGRCPDCYCLAYLATKGDGQ